MSRRERLPVTARLVTLPVAGHRLSVGSGGTLVVETERLAFDIDPGSGAVTPRAALRGNSVRRDDPAVVLGEPVLAERLLVSLWVGHEGSAEVRRRLVALYDQLGWTLAREVLAGPT
jgi:hypothetical protein